ncbi:MAG: alpha/beta fold hydrolase [Syntrophomonadaceae bacterium]
MKEIFINTGDESNLAAYLWGPGAGDKYMVVICHGFRGAKENGGKVFGFADKLRRAGVGVLAFDFRGSGQSEGDFSTVTLTRQGQDLKQVIDYIDTRFGLPVIVLGRSMGGSSVLVGASGDDRVAGFIFWSTPVFMQAAFSTIMGKDYARLRAGQTVIFRDDGGQFELCPDLADDFDRHDMDVYIKKIGWKPALIVQARDDDAVSPANGEYLHQMLPNSQLSMFDQAGHRFLELTGQREDLTVEWLRQNFF